MAMYVGLEHGGGRRVGAKNKDGGQSYSKKWMILSVERNKYPPPSSGVRSDPMELRRFRILCLFGAFGVVCRFGTGRQDAGRGHKRRTASEINPTMADSSRREKYPPSAGAHGRRGGVVFFLSTRCLVAGGAAAGGFRPRIIWGNPAITETCRKYYICHYYRPYLGNCDRPFLFLLNGRRFPTRLRRC